MNEIISQPITPLMRHLNVIVGNDTLFVLTAVSHGQPKKALIKHCFGIKRDENETESGKLPDNPGVIPNWNIRTACSAFEMEFGKVFAQRNGLRVGEDDGNVFVFLGFKPTELQEGQ